ncbi:MAG: nucleotidyl transferase AbiEii/AbiGii toxin family protein [Flavobacteriales bacterium]|nr:nucleotidyl transferase AbiEii/AbiGii toxin family protein [Flavobacteriales bacterium]
MIKTNFQNIPIEDRKSIFKEITSKSGIPDYAVEKDWWVVQTLSIIFEMEIGKHLVFKGGTSLSKAWGLIDRFSEDVDLAVDRSFYGFEGELSKNKRTKLRKKASAYITDIFYPELKERFEESGLDVKIKIIEPLSSDQDPRIIEVYYPNVISSPGYIQPRVQVEIGSRSMREPFTVCSFSTLVDETYPDKVFTHGAIEIPTVNPERTFLEKIFLLHEEFQRPVEKIRVNRLSRHLYDIYQLSKTEFADKALSNEELYKSIVEHRRVFTKVGGVDYKLHSPKTINPIPNEELLEVWKKDYKTMQEQMIYGDSPDFEEMIVGIKKLKQRINQLNWQVF